MHAVESVHDTCIDYPHSISLMDDANCHVQGPQTIEANIIIATSHDTINTIKCDDTQS